MTNTSNFIHICALDDIPVLGARRVETSEGEIALFRTTNDQVFALMNQCPHKKGPLSEGIVHGNSVTCPLHNWVISLKTGEAQGADAGCSPTIPVELRGKEVYMSAPATAKKALAKAVA
jgi:nitrite reductase (NADH) small subunit